MAGKSNKEKPTLRILGEMKVGEKRWFPAARLGSVKTMCSEYGFQWNKTFTTAINRESNGFIVTRTR